MFHCENCPDVRTAVTAAPIAVLRDDGILKWTAVSLDEPVHLVALFRDPGIRDNRVVPTVLDLRVDQSGFLVSGANCWIGHWLRSFGELPQGLRVALDNGVRCPWPKDSGAYEERAIYCLPPRASWVRGLQHPAGGFPGVLVCDSDLAGVMANLRQLTCEDGSDWRPPHRFVDAIGERVRCFGRDGLICPHPMMLSPRFVHRDSYARRIKNTNLASAIRALARV
jgi:hypothetical protein